MDQNAYNFLNNDNNGDSDKKKRLLIAGGGFVVLAIVITLLLVLAFGGKQDTRQILLPIAGTQADLIAITTAGNKDLRDSEALNQSATTSLVITSHNNITNGYIGDDATKSTKAYQKTDYTANFEEAASNGTFDQTYKTILSQRLDLYRQQLVTAYSELENGDLKQQIAKFHDESKLLSASTSED